MNHRNAWRVDRLSLERHLRPDPERDGAFVVGLLAMAAFALLVAAGVYALARAL